MRQDKDRRPRRKFVRHSCLTYRYRCRALAVPLWLVLLGLPTWAVAQRGQFDATPVDPRDEAYIFTPAGLDRPGAIKQTPAEGAAQLAISVIDRATGERTPCRINVVGPDGNFYHPAKNPLAEYSMRGHWPQGGQGNRPAKAPIRYFGHFFYSTGACVVDVPAGSVRIEVFKGLEYAPVTTTVEARHGESRELRIELQRTLDMSAQGYWSGDPHLHFPRGSDAEDTTILDLLAAEDIRFGVVMCYNETNEYAGSMSQLVMPQGRGLGRRSKASRGQQHIISGQEYRNNVYGHLNLFLRDDLVAAGESYDPNHWPVFGIVGRQTQALGGYAIHAHGGYAQEIFADAVQQATHGVELLQFGIYRGISLENWYRLLNCGLRFPAVGASDYPACRKLGDCLTYVRHEGEPSIEQWLAGLAAGRSFVTTGPMLLLDVYGRQPGDSIRLEGQGPHRVAVRLRARCDVAPITHLQLIEGGKVVAEKVIERQAGQGDWLEVSAPLEIDQSSWIAARAFSKAPSGSPDAESHANPVYLYVDGRAPYREEDVDWLAGELDAQVQHHRQRDFPERQRVVEYFEQSRKIVDHIRQRRGLPAPQLAAADIRQQVSDALRQPLLPADKPLAEARALIDRRVARLPDFTSRDAWEQYAGELRQKILDEVVFRGEAAAWRDARTKVEWLDTIEGLPGYRIRKLRYEALPGLWIPALLYEPTDVEGRLPVVLNVNGHDPEGKSSRDEQIRSINCAKRGMLALHPEWVGMGQLRSDGFVHGRMNQLDLCGTSGLSVFYLSLSRAIDVLCDMPNADPARVAVTGLSGGGWQTAWIAALDERVTLANPVAGYTSLRTAIAHDDMGDSEQAPSDFAAIADSLHLTALRAPRWTLLTYNAADDCCFKSEHTLAPLLDAARPIYELLGASDRLRWHVNRDPGTHNYERDNRQAFYAIVGDAFYPGAADYPREELPTDGELKTAEELAVPMPERNLDFNRLATQLAHDLARKGPAVSTSGSQPTAQQRREQLRSLLKMPQYDARPLQQATHRGDGVTVRTWLVTLGDDWTVPVVEFGPPVKRQGAPPLLLLCDGGFGDQGLVERALKGLNTGRHVFAVDPLLVGQSKITGSDPQVYFAIALASVGERPLGLQAAQLAAVARWIGGELGQRVEIAAYGPRTEVMALTAAASEPGTIQITQRGSLPSLRKLIEENRAIEEYPELFPFGLLAEFDLEDLRRLADQRD